MRWHYPIVLGVLLLVLIGFLTQVGLAQNSPKSDLPNQKLTPVLLENVQIFNGISEQLSAPSNVLVVDHKIQTISTTPIPKLPNTDVVQIKGGGRVLMPGLIDAHTHLLLETIALEELLSPKTSTETVFEKAKENVTTMLMSGFTSTRDMAGPVFELKKAIDRGDVVGPRIWPSGAMISQTGGHGDFRSLQELPRTSSTPLSRAEEFGQSAIADGVDEVLRRTREQLMLGASQIKLAAGGGVASSYDPIDVSQYTESELHAAVEAAANWNTYVAVHAYTPNAIHKPRAGHSSTKSYVAVHAYTPNAIQTAIRAGVKCIEHGQLMDEKTAKMIAEQGIWLSIQPFLDDEDANPYPEGSANRARQLQVAEGTDVAYNLARKYNIKTAWGTDTLYSAKKATRRGAILAKMVRWYTPAEVLKMATRTNAQLLMLSGPRNPYPGKLGVVEEGALADLLLFNGNPLENIQLIENPDNFVVVMKDGVVYKNLLNR